MPFRWRYTLPLRLRSLVRRDRVEDELDEEIRYHIDERARELMAKGLTERDARLSALRSFGGVEQRKEECRDARRLMLVDDVRRDLVYAGRMLRRSPGFTAVAVLSLALGIGANTAIFSILDALAFRTLPIAEPDRLVLLDTDQSIGLTRFARLREHLTGFSNVSAVWTIDRSNIIIGTGAADGRATQTDAGQARIGLASADYFSTMGVTLASGRTFTAEEERTERPVAVMSDAYWRRHFGRPPDVAGRSFRLNGETYDIVGVAPSGFTGEWVGVPTDVWVPFSLASRVMPEVPGGPQRFPRRVLARLEPGVTIDQAEASTRVLYRRILAEEAGAKVTPEELDQIARTRLDLQSLARGYSPQRRSFAQPLAILAVGVAVLLLIACANLANLLLARSAGRQREIAVRLAIGAGRSRLVRQMLTESMVLSAAGGVLGVLLALWAKKILMVMVAAAPVVLGGSGTGLSLELSFDIRALAFTIGVCVLAVLLFGTVPAFSSARIPLAGSLTSSSARLVAGARFGPSTLLVIAQIALSLLLLIGAGLFGRTLANLRAEDLGFERQHELLVWTVPGQTGRQDLALAGLWHTVRERLSAVPGVVSAAATNQAMLRGVDLEPGGSVSEPMRVEGEPAKPVAAVGFRSFITPGFFGTLGVPIVAGRDFTERDTETAPRVAIINEAMARFYFGDRSAVGRLVRFPWPTPAPVEIVGVAADYAKGTPRGAKRPEFATYFPYRDPEALNKGAQSRLRVMLVVIRTTGDPLAVADRVRAELRAIDPELPVLRINTTEQHVEDVLAQDRLVAVLSSVFGVIAVSMACLGLFGLISYRVARRTGEIGVRLALGATRRGILRMILAESSRLVVAGLGIGLICAFFLARLIATRLYGIGASDPLTVTAAMMLLVAVAAVAALIPARRAAGVDPLTALRSE
jgi:predicted permease